MLVMQIQSVVKLHTTNMHTHIPSPWCSQGEGVEFGYDESIHRRAFVRWHLCSMPPSVRRLSARSVFPSSSDTLPEELLCRTIQANSHEQVSRLSLSQQAGRQAGKEVPVKGHGEWTSRFDALAAIFACGIKKAPPGLKAGVGLKESVAPAAANKSTALKFV